MAKQGNPPERGKQKGSHQTGTRKGQDPKSKAEALRQADVRGANDTGNKSQGGKFDSGNQTNR